MSERIADVSADPDTVQTSFPSAPLHEETIKERRYRRTIGFIAVAALAGVAAGYTASHYEDVKKIKASETVANTAILLSAHGITGIQRIGVNEAGETTALISSNLDNPKACADIFIIPGDSHVVLAATNDQSHIPLNGISFDDHKGEVAAFVEYKKLNGTCE